MYTSFVTSTPHIYCFNACERKNKNKLQRYIIDCLRVKLLDLANMTVNVIEGFFVLLKNSF